MEDQTGNDWEILSLDSDYEINIEYPYKIRRRGKTEPINEWLASGYYSVKLNGIRFFKHKIIVTQFIKNDDQSKNIIDHINRDKTDNRVENLRYVSSSESNKNRSKIHFDKFEFLHELPESAVEISEYNGHIFEDYYFDPDSDIIVKIHRYKNVDRIKVVKPTIYSNRYRVRLVDVDGKPHTFDHDKIVKTLREAIA